ncbi:tRNA glutamyl-Q(34) synthetase GluQRS [Zoogloea sp.]|jgi:glutamyl-Q tRNA(Asp) synthetase|uniref:tRNA glutamyl-Q(34) synthetase GluQRS n=1 Tax=Zoogloea sp. TaxID=49181 RepID=UPI001DEE45D6|nr:tRNA glutamyl-Q(34) synthetase GluQRS [Zoogloea sp.]MBK6656081.1 tRNA glutamyl-Q(34) synthetase GluQRS [Zoogloea sp.]MBK7848731.1 tRNA glutamyl-Q(34) synthetase GluQRS [Zoogloea sp.]HOY02906.1 tRNA glutamyl-Q(34) synthetase GluQRS [Zoogloea sp.]
MRNDVADAPTVPPVGRFAPSPSGPLHFGSMVAALGSCLSARSRQGRWLLRIEDVDLPRSVPGAADGILRTLEAFGFAWDGEVVWQSRRTAAYREAFARLKADGQLFGCACTRKEMADSGLARDGTRRYPGTCRAGLPAGREARAWRLRVPPGRIVFLDGIQGRIEEDVSADVGDFVLLRADGLFAYQLAVVVDDAEAGVTEVVRGADLLDSTARQIVLQHLLALPTPSYAHLPVAINGAGEKLSKQTLARSVAGAPPARVLVDALAFLGQSPPPGLADGGLSDVWQWALRNWSLARVPSCRAAPCPAYA